jgi:hypothetical protein
MAVLVALLVVILLLGAGEAVHLLWITAVVALILWLAGFMLRTVEGGRWYRW